MSSKKWSSILILSALVFSAGSAFAFTASRPAVQHRLESKAHQQSHDGHAKTPHSHHHQRHHS